jgi:hypothetical protein
MSWLHAKQLEYKMEGGVREKGGILIAVSGANTDLAIERESNSLRWLMCPPTGNYEVKSSERCVSIVKCH